MWSKEFLRWVYNQRTPKKGSKRRRRRRALKKKEALSRVTDVRQRRPKQKKRATRPTKFVQIVDIPYFPWTLNVGYRERGKDRKRKRSVYPVSEQRLPLGLTIKKPQVIRKPSYVAKHTKGLLNADQRRILICRKRYSRRVALFALKHVGLGRSGAGSGRRKITNESKIKC